MYTPPKRTAGQGSNREERLFQILCAMLWNEYRCNRKSGDITVVGTYQIAKLINMKPSQHLRGMLHELALAGYLIYSQGAARNGVMREEWCLTDAVEYHPRANEMYGTLAAKDEARHAS